MKKKRTVVPSTRPITTNNSTIPFTNPKNNISVITSHHHYHITNASFILPFAIHPLPINTRHYQSILHQLLQPSYTSKPLTSSTTIPITTCNIPSPSNTFPNNVTSFTLETKILKNTTSSITILNNITFSITLSNTTPSTPLPSNFASSKIQGSPQQQKLLHHSPQQHHSLNHSLFSSVLSSLPGISSATPPSLPPPSPRPA
ncbi:hypothetical protein Pcinc_027305 [Petrolisthes cinctipes]|uniref:Uncharacterized protein n=1 Tax=Petrolisthes cinctipes TaxID=88211 RepID=A0AAE1K6Z0_PETCI|nr:hypothetical protein Pcinc_027305 [Petrolisthes cinctipes]